MKFSRVETILINNQATCFIRNYVPGSFEYILAAFKVNK